MAYGTPADPVGGTVITVAYAVANLLDPIRWLRLLTGNADPPGASYVVVSSSTTGTSWARVPTDAIADGAITTAKVAALAITDALIASVSGAKILDGTIPSGKLGTGSVIAVNIAAGNVDDSKISGVSGTKISDGTIPSGKLGTGAVIAVNIADGNVTDAKIATVDGSKIVNNSIPSGKLATDAIIAANISDGNVTAAKLAAGVAASNLGFTPVRKATGTYSGSGSTSGRQITTGFTAIHVVIQTSSAPNDVQYTTVNTSNCMRNSQALPVQFQSGVHLHASDGFVVGDGTTLANDSGSTFSWVAYG